MLFLKLFFKKIQKNPFTYLINFSGLLLSLVIVAILGVYCLSEFTTDSHHKNKDQVFLIQSTEGEDIGCHMPAIFKDYIDANFPAVLASVRMEETWDTPVFQVDDNPPLASQLLFADTDFFTLFSYTAIEGNLQTALTEPLSVVLTESEAQRFFGAKHAVGKSIKLNNGHTLKVTAVIQEPVHNTCMSVKAITTIKAREIIYANPEEFTNWGWHNFKLFLLLEDNTDTQWMEQQLTSAIKANTGIQEIEISLLPLGDIYFSEMTENFGNLVRQGNKAQTYILMLVALLVLVIAMVNYVNISSAHLLDSVKRVGIQKIIGAGRLAIFKNIVLESMLFFIVTAVLSIYISIAVAPAVQQFTGISFSHQLLASPLFMLCFAGLAVIIGFLVVLWPAIIYSISPPINNLHKNASEHKSLFRNSMVVAQFSIAIILFTFTMLVQKQVKFGTLNLGFNRENAIGIKLTPQLQHKRDILKKQLVENAYVENVSFSQFFPGKAFSYWITDLTHDNQTKSIGFHILSADAEFVNILDLELLQGRFYTEKSMDKNTALVNEEFLKTCDIENPIGATFKQSAHENCEIIGVIKDFHFQPVNKKIEPLVIRNNNYASYCLVKANTGDFTNLHTFIQQMKDITAELSPAFPVEISFIDSATEHMYTSELQFRRLFSLFSGCAILICCFGLLAMSIFACQRRIKEIGIRKVIGAKSWEIVMLLNMDFIKWVMMAIVVAIPLSWSIMHRWLQNFAYKTDINGWLFLAAGGSALIIALFTVSFQTIRAATANPVEALRYE